MLQIDLSSLGGPELRQLLDTTRKRGQAKLSYQILQEMAARRERGGVPSSEPRVIAVDLGDPMDRHDEFYDEPDAAPAEPRDEAQYEAGEPMSDEADDAPLYLGEREPKPSPAAAALVAAAARQERRRDKPPRGTQPPRRALWITVGFALGMAAEGGLAWWMGVPGFAHRTAEAASAPAPMKPAQVAEAVLPPAALPEPPPLPVEGTADAALSPGPAAAEAATPAPAVSAPVAVSAPAPAAPIKAEAESELPPPPDLPPARPAAQLRAEARAKARAEARAEAGQDAGEAPASTVKLAAAGPKGCDAQTTPADRTICGDAKLQRLQRELRSAYAEALDAHQDRDTLRQRQLAWADARNGVSEPGALAKLYEERVKKLKAATEAAKRER